jgi:hypothetical protein
VKIDVSGPRSVFKLEAGHRPWRKSAREKAGWGVFLIALGVMFLLIRLGVIERHQLREWWPMILITMGAAWIVVPSKPRQIASGVTFVLIGLWFFACIQHWYGLTYRTAWPLLVVVAGLEMVLTATLDRLWPSEKEKEERHA